MALANVLMRRFACRRLSLTPECEKALLALQRSGAALKKASLRSKSGQTLQDLKEFIKDVKLPPIVHIAGTKGKGSVASFTETMLRKQGLRTAMYTSPHLISVRERFRIDGKMVNESVFETEFWDCLQHIPQDSRPGYFAFLTVLGLRMFSKANVDVLVLEVGIGGRLDPTNIIPKDSVVACGITTVALDHCEFLGSSLESIAKEKAGIFKKGVPAFSSRQVRPDIENVLTKCAEDSGCDLEFVDDIDSDVLLSLNGGFQRKNAALALELSSTVLPTVPRSVLQKGLADTKWPGRCQVLRHPAQSNLVFYIDGAHTPESVSECTRWYEEEASGEVRALVFNCGGTRNPVELLQPLSSNITKQFDFVLSSPFDASKPTNTPPMNLEAMLKSTDLQVPPNIYDIDWNSCILEVWKLLAQPSRETKYQSTPNVSASIDCLLSVARDSPSKEVSVLVTGSLYLAGDLLKALEFDDF